mmetsp:Transcript_41456/g.105612  ORF Transcript_41456/g.105612 Transcript_41456/m.105612 type:complete len:357 (-) Transcript_41456:104-1174(-)
MALDSTSRHGYSCCILDGFLHRRRKQGLLESGSWPVPQRIDAVQNIRQEDDINECIERDAVLREVLGTKTSLSKHGHMYLLQRIHDCMQTQVSDAVIHTTCRQEQSHVGDGNVGIGTVHMKQFSQPPLVPHLMVLTQLWHRQLQVARRIIVVFHLGGVLREFPAWDHLLHFGDAALLGRFSIRRLDGSRHSPHVGHLGVNRHAVVACSDRPPVSEGNSILRGSSMKSNLVCGLRPTTCGCSPLHCLHHRRPLPWPRRMQVCAGTYVTESGIATEVEDGRGRGTEEAVNTWRRRRDCRRSKQGLERRRQGDDLHVPFKLAGAVGAISQTEGVEVGRRGGDRRLLDSGGLPGAPRLHL